MMEEMYSPATRQLPRLADLPAPPVGRAGWPWTEESPELPERLPGGRAWPAISVVTPTGGRGILLEETIRSVLLQHYPNLEYIVVDTGQAKETTAVVKKYEAWITHVVAAPRSGRARAMNMGLAHATGDFFNWVHCGDMLSAGAIGIIARVSARADVVAGGRILRLGSDRERHDLAARLSARGLLLMEPRSKPPQLAVWMHRRQMLQAGPLNEDLNIAGLVDLYIRYLHRFPRVKYVNMILGWSRARASHMPDRDAALLDRAKMVDTLRSMEAYRGLWPDCDHAGEKVAWWLHVSRSAQDKSSSTLRRALRLFIDSQKNASVRWDDETKRVLRKIILG